jgi:hypothetical protein
MGTTFSNIKKDDDGLYFTYYNVYICRITFKNDNVLLFSYSRFLDKSVILKVLNSERILFSEIIDNFDASKEIYIDNYFYSDNFRNCFMILSHNPISKYLLKKHDKFKNCKLSHFRDITYKCIGGNFYIASNTFITRNKITIEHIEFEYKNGIYRVTNRIDKNVFSTIINKFSKILCNPIYNDENLYEIINDIYEINKTMMDITCENILDIQIDQLYVKKFPIINNNPLLFGNPIELTCDETSIKLEHYVDELRTIKINIDNAKKIRFIYDYVLKDKKLYDNLPDNFKEIFKYNYNIFKSKVVLFLRHGEESFITIKIPQSLSNSSKDIEKIDVESLKVTQH